MKKSKIEVVLGDITKQNFDAIVNAANKSLLAGGGVDGAIHRAAGPELEEECIELGGCPTGEAKITKAYGLNRNSVHWVIHAVGPRWFDGSQNEESLLENAYLNSLMLAVNYKKLYPRQCIEVLMKYISHKDKTMQEKLIKEVREEAERYAEEHPIRTIAFPSISTGIYHFPVERAAVIATSAVKKFLSSQSALEQIAIVCFDKTTFDYYRKNI